MGKAADMRISLITGNILMSDECTLSSRLANYSYLQRIHDFQNGLHPPRHPRYDRDVPKL